MEKNAFLVWVSNEYPDASIEIISNTNNEIYKIISKNGTFCIKNMLDIDIPLEYFAKCSKVMEGKILTQKIIKIIHKNDQNSFNCIVSEYLEGCDLAHILKNGSGQALQSKKTVEFFLGYMNICEQFPLMFDGFGIYKSDAPSFDNHGSFLCHYARKYWSRARPYFERPIVNWVDQWIEGGLKSALIAPAGYISIPVDSNLRNFLVTNDQELAVLNVPIVGRSSRAHAVAAISTHLRPFAEHRQFLDRATDGWSDAESAAVTHFEAWTLLGILSFYAVREPETPQNWRNWGATRGLRDEFTDVIRQLSEVAL